MKKLISWILTAVIATSCLPIIAHAETSGTCGDHLTWILNDDGVLTIDGIGNMDNYDYVTTMEANTPWYNIRYSIKTVILMDGVTSIGNYAFSACNNLANITIPNSVTSIGKRAFYRCESLTSINIPNGVISIGDSTFSQCFSLTNVTIPNSVTSIGNSAFYWCKNLTNITIPSGVTSIGNYAFSDCENLTSVIIPNGVQTIESSLFWNCYSLKNVIIPKGVSWIGAGAFGNCTSLKNIYYGGTETQWEGIKKSSSPGIGLGTANIHYNSYYVDTEKSIDNYIINEVKKYTESDACAQFDAIMSANITGEERFRRLNEFFHNEGITDLKEGMQYVSESFACQRAYDFLTTNEVYCAFNYFDWLNSTTYGLAARAALYSSGLIFNAEVFSYMDLSTYAESDYPGIKKNKTLLKKIMEVDNDSTVSDIFSYSNKTAKFLKNMIKMNNIITDDAMDELMDKILNASTQGELEIFQRQFTEMIVKQIEANSPNANVLTVNICSENFGKALNASSNILKFTGATVDDIISLAQLDNDIETYKKYSRFLTTIYSNPNVSFEMRLAAYQLLNEIDNGYYNKAVSMICNVMDLANGFIYTDKSMLQTFLEEQGISESGSGLFADALGTIKLATYISNIVIDTGDFVKQVAYTQGYAELSALYSLKLEEDKQAFLANETAENAWMFFEDYTMLWKLRYNGEQQYLDMSSVKMFILASVKTYKYEEKEEVVRDNQEYLNKCKFKLSSELEVPTSIQYEKKSVVHCPVDVYVYNNTGELIAELKDGVESNIVNEYGRFAVVRESYSGEYAKVICQSTKDDLTIKMSAVGDGLVDYQSNSIDSTGIKSIDKLLVDTGNLIEIIGDDYSIDKDNDGNIDIQASLVSKEIDDYIRAESVAFTEQNLNISYGQSKSVGVILAPENTTNTALEWISLDKNIATVKNGLVTGVGIGTTTIIAKVCDSDEIECELSVVVEKLNSSVIIIPTARKLTYTGELQELVTLGTAEGGTIQYSFDGKNYSNDIPKAINAGEYTVYYKVVGDEGYNDTEPETIMVTIEPAKEDTPYIEIDFKNETLTGFGEGNYTINDEYVAPIENELRIENYIGKTISVMKKASDTNHDDSESHWIEIPTRPFTPSENIFTVTQPQIIEGTGTIEGITANMEYSTDNGETWIDGDDGNITNIAGGTTYLIRIKATDTNFASEFRTITIIPFGAEQEPTPDININYVDETLIDFESGNYTINNTEVTPSENGTLDIDESYYSKTVLIVKKGDNLTTVDSTSQTLTIPTRLSAPNVTTSAVTAVGRNDGKIIGTTADMEYRLSGSETWTDCTNTEITGLASGTYEVRIKSNTSTFSSIITRVRVDAECVKIIAQYTDDGVLEDIKIEKSNVSEITLPQNIRTNKVFYWESLESMKPIELN